MNNKMTSQFLTDLIIGLVDNCPPTDEDRIWILHDPLVYSSELLNCTVTVPTGFQTDLASVPRVPLLYIKWGNRAHREAVIHDYLYRIDSIPVVDFDVANKIFREAMIARGKPKDVYEAMYRGVALGGHSSYHKKHVEDRLI